MPLWRFDGGQVEIVCSWLGVQLRCLRRFAKADIIGDQPVGAKVRSRDLADACNIGHSGSSNE